MAAYPSAREAEADAAARAGRLPEARRLLEAAVAETPQRLEAWLKLRAMCRGMGDIEAAMTAVSRALTLDPLDFSALLAKARLIEQRHGSAAAGEAYGNALAQRPPAGAEPPGLTPILEHADRCYRAFQEASLQQLRGGLRDAPDLSPEEQGKIDRFCSNISRSTLHYHQQPSHFHYPGLAAFEFHDRSHFAWMEELEAATPQISAEFEALTASEAAELVPYIQYAKDLPLRQWEELNHSRQWTAIHLLQNGKLIDQNARHCPKTMALLRSFPQPHVVGQSPNAMFSLLAPRTRIPPHTGVSNTRLVCHLPLIVPPGCGFRVGAQTRRWEVGEAFVFDDTIEHEAWNDSDELRVVLIFDLWAWALSEGERDAVAAIIAGSGIEAAEAL